MQRTVSRRRFMKGLGATALAPMIPAALQAQAPAGDPPQNKHRILCCNIRVALPEDDAKGVGWQVRKDICIHLIQQQKPDIICLQEVLRGQAADMKKAFAGYTAFGFEGPEMDAHPQGYHGIAKNMILFSTARYELVSAGCFWLSQTPHLAGSLSWNTARARHCNWVRLQDRASKKEFRMLNTHLDHQSQEAREQQVKMIVEEARQYQEQFPQLLAGDFNEDMTNPVISIIKENSWTDTYAAVHGPADPGYTGHSFLGKQYADKAKKGKIDFIFCKGPVTAQTATILKDDRRGIYPSDHYFVSTEVVL